MQPARRNLLIVGAGGCGREVLSYIKDDNSLFDAKGFSSAWLDALDAKPVSALLWGQLLSCPRAGWRLHGGDRPPQMRFKFTVPLRDVHRVGLTPAPATAAVRRVQGRWLVPQAAR